MDLQLDQIITQVLGFLIAVWLLKRYAWKGLLDFMDKRRSVIASSFQEIEDKRAEVQSQKQKYDRELEKIEATRRARIQEAAQEANRLASEIKEEARREAIALQDKARRDIAIEIDKANAILRDRMVDAVIISTEKVIKERLDKRKHRQLISNFLDELQVEQQ